MRPVANVNIFGPTGRCAGLWLVFVGMLAAAFSGGCGGSQQRQPRCGNGVVEGVEECDDGNTFPGDGCSPMCLEEGGEICGNYEDDDEDGNADCADSDCVGHSTCTDPENRIENCHNGLDDDQDGQADCEDTNCQDTSFCVGEEVCGNGEDDDKDGATDCDDMECDGHPLCEGCPPDTHLGTLSPEWEDTFQVETPQDTTPSMARCPSGNGPDVEYRFVLERPVHLEARLQSPPNESWGLALLKEEEPDVTCEVDEVACSVAREGLANVAELGLPPGTYRLAVKAGEEGGAGPLALRLRLADGSMEMDCTDGLDEDGDGATDCDDSDCEQASDCIPEICYNSVDDDGDGQTDCADPECQNHPICLPPEACDNGADDDGDGLTDCSDPECAGSQPCTGSECVVNADLGVLGRSDVVNWSNWNTYQVADDSVTSCGNPGTPEIVATFELEHLATVSFTMTQSSWGQHVLAFATEAGPGSWCDHAEIGCAASGGVGETLRKTYVQLPAARYFVLIEAVDSSTRSSGSLKVEVFDPLAEICDDSVDDDNDGMTDCDDPDCFAAAVCLPESVCHDGVDEDMDGRTDCADLDCIGTAACVAGACVPDRDLGVVSALGPGYVVDSSESAPDELQAECSLGGGGPERVIGFTLQAQTGVTLRLNQQPGSDHVMSLAVPAGPGTDCDHAQYICAESGGPGLPIVLQVENLPAGDYYVLVDAFNPAGSGGFSLQVSLW